MKENYELISFIHGSRRRAVLNSLKDGPKIPKQIAEECKISISNVSNTISELNKKSLIICKNPKSKVYRYYEITQRGKEILKQILKTEKSTS